MSPLGNSWGTSIGIWVIWLAILIIYNWRYIKRLRFQSPLKLANQSTGNDDTAKQEIEPSIFPQIDKLGIVINAIANAKRATPKGKDIIVYMTDDNGIKPIFLTELKDILIKLQDDEKVLELIEFPDWLTPHDEITQSDILNMVKVTTNPSLRNFKVRVLKRFDKFKPQ
jgi:hypothetical protein